MLSDNLKTTPHKTKDGIKTKTRTINGKTTLSHHLSNQEINPWIKVTIKVAMYPSQTKVKPNIYSGFNNNVQPNYGQQPMMPGQQPMPNLQPGNKNIIQKKSLLSENTHLCLVVCADLTVWAHGGKVQAVPLTHGAFVCSSAFGLFYGCPSAWTAVTTLKFFAADVVKLKLPSLLIAVEINDFNSFIHVF